MQKKSDKKTIIALLIVLAIVAIGSGIWTYNTFQTDDFSLEPESDIELDYVFRVKDEAIDNINDFLDVDFAPGTVWDKFYDNQQFNRLKYLEIDIDTDNNVGNPSPFVASTSTEEGGEKDL